MTVPPKAKEGPKRRLIVCHNIYTKHLLAEEALKFLDNSVRMFVTMKLNNTDEVNRTVIKEAIQLPEIDPGGS